ncbi:uncharacterized protein LOC144573664 [Carex rostrata]
MGVLDLREFNNSLLMKWFWWWYKPETKLWKPLLENTTGRIRYVPDAVVFNQLKGDFLDLFYDRVKFLPGNGKNISLREHDWGKGILKHKFPALYSFVINSDISLYQGVMTYHQLTGSFRPNMSGQAMAEFQQLGAKLQQLRLIQHKPDDIQWADATTGAFSYHRRKSHIRGKEKEDVLLSTNP